MSVKALQDYTFSSKYARYIPEKKRRETWAEAVERVCEMHVRRYPQIKKEIEWAFEQSRQKRVLGSQRALQFGGKAIEKKNARQLLRQDQIFSRVLLVAFMRLRNGLLGSEAPHCKIAIFFFFVDSKK